MDNYTKLIYNVNWESRINSYEKQVFNNFKPNQITKETGIIIDNGSYKCKAVLL